MKTLMQIILIQKHKNKAIKSGPGLNVVRPNSSTFMDDKESFYYIIENITE